MKYKKSLAALALAALGGFSGAANATLYSNSNDAGSIFSFGYPDTTSYGQTFNVGVASTVQDWTFYATGGSAGNLELVIANWDGSKAVGPAVYTSSLFSYTGGAEALAFSGINAALSAGSYIAYITTAGVGAPASSVALAGSNSNGGLGGSFRFLNSNNVDPLTLNNSWNSWYIPNMQFAANIVEGVSNVPEPATLALFGLGILGISAMRRKVR